MISLAQSTGLTENGLFAVISVLWVLLQAAGGAFILSVLKRIDRLMKRLDELTERIHALEVELAKDLGPTATATAALEVRIDDHETRIRALEHPSRQKP